jgi:hypothetical protein
MLLTLMVSVATCLSDDQTSITETSTAKGKTTTSKPRSASQRRKRQRKNAGKCKNRVISSILSLIQETSFQYYGDMWDSVETLETLIKRLDDRPLQMGVSYESIDFPVFVAKETGLKHSAEILKYGITLREWVRRKKQSRDHKLVASAIKKMMGFVWEYRDENDEWKQYDQRSQYVIQEALSKGKESCWIFANGKHYLVEMLLGVQKVGGYKSSFPRECRASSVRLSSKWREWRRKNDQAQSYSGVLPNGTPDFLPRNAKTMYKRFLEGKPLPFPKPVDIDCTRMVSLSEEVKAQFPDTGFNFRKKVRAEQPNGYSLGFGLIDVGLDTAEAHRFRMRYERSLRHRPDEIMTIRKLFAVQHPDHFERWVQYAQSGSRRDRVRCVRAWHGTKVENLGSILQDGFDPLYCMNGINQYGCGAYFAKRPSYSYAYSDGTSRELGDGLDAKVLILCSVLVTDSVVGSRGQNSVPFRPNRPTPDTFTNGDKSIYVTRNVAQALPLYVVVLGCSASGPL